jgi:GT2 family glycosyltransferase
MGFRRAVLEQTDGFRQVTRYAEDMEFIFRARRRGYRATFVPEAVVTHDPDRTTFPEIFAYAVAHGASSVVLRSMYRSLLRTPFVLRSAPALLLAAPLMALTVTVRIFLTNPRAVRWFTTAPIVYVLKLGWCLGAASELRRRGVPREAA